MTIADFLPIVEGVNNNRFNGKIDSNLIGVVAHCQRLEKRVLLTDVDDCLVSQLLVHWLSFHSEPKIETGLLDIIVGGDCTDESLATFRSDVFEHLLRGDLNAQEVGLNLHWAEKDRGGDQRVHGNGLFTLLDLVKLFGQTKRQALRFVVLVLLDVAVQIDWICILDKHLTKPSLSLVVDPHH